MTELAKIKGIREIISSFGLGTLIETGCYEGDGIQTALSLGIRQAYSCDIGLSSIETCRQRFKNQAVYLWHDLSSNALPEMCESVDGRTLFWLDAHMPSMYGLGGYDDDHKYPIINELQVIKDHKFKFVEDVIIIDDTRVIKSSDNPRFDDEEVICCDPITGITIHQITKILSDTHLFQHVFDHEGYIIFTPK